jgi:pimeloyl-ACP methyl ester carboxylesterase
MTDSEDIIGRYVKVNGTRMFYDEVGSGTPIICIHTAGASSLLYRYLLPILADNGFRAIAPDLPGRCRSYAVNWEPTRRLHDHAETVYAFIKAVCGDEKVVVTGASIGGNIVFDLIAHHSEDLLAAIPMDGAARTPTFPDPFEATHLSWCPGWQALLELNSAAVLNPATPPEKVTELRWIHRNAQISAVGDAEGWATHDVRGKLGNVQCPVLVLSGADDFFLPKVLLRETEAELPEAEFRILEGTGHYPPFESPELVAGLITDFVRTKTAAAAS